MHRVCFSASMLLASALLGLVLLCNRPAQAAPDAPVKITFFIWAGSNQGVVPREVFKAYREAHPEVTIEELESTNAITYPKMVAARRTTPDNPMVSCGFFNVDAITRGDADEMWESMNPERIPNLANVLPQYRRLDNRGVGYQMSGIGILYNKNAVKTPPTSWTALWDPANRGRVVMFDYNTQMLSIAARLNGGSEHDIDPGFKIWSDNAQNLRALFGMHWPAGTRGWRHGSPRFRMYGSPKVRHSPMRCRRRAQSGSRCSCRSHAGWTPTSDTCARI